MIHAGMKNKILYWSLRVLIILLGMFLIVFGGIDDSPGAQLIGLVLIVTSIVFIFKGKKKI